MNGSAYVRTRLGSFLAIAPLGVYVVVHLWDNLAAFDGPAAWEERVVHHDSVIGQYVLLGVVLAPLLLHTAWGIGRLLTTRANNVHYRTFANLKYALQRLSAVGLLLFLGAHLWLALFRPRFVEHRVDGEPFAAIAHEMRFHGPTLVVYVLGLLAVAYHLANGVSTFAMGWGVVTSRRGLEHLDRAVYALFAVLLAMGLLAIYALWAAGAPA